MALFPETKAPTHDQRTIILAPTGKDSLLIAGLLERRSMPCHAAASIEEVCVEIGRGAGAAIVCEEALTVRAITQLHRVVDEQPPWSDFPLILLTVGGRVTVQSERLRKLRRPLGNIFLLERPIRPETLLSTLEIALRGRQRQYQIRDQMQQYARAQEALRRSEKLAVTGRLAASIAHEINNPLEAVTNLLYLIRSTPDADQSQKYLDDAEMELARVAEIARQTLRFYREPNHPIDTDVGSVLRSVLVLYNSRLAAADIAVQMEIDPDPATVLASPGELRQVIANLVGNAIDAMRRGGRLRIRVSTENAQPNAQRLRLTIGDTGSGIPAALLPAIFEPFVTTKGETGTGTGLGLWVTGEIIRRNGWAIRVRTRCAPAAAGTVFSITMPLRTETLPATLATHAAVA
ncbi:MAG TPA: ATP-binding protein [Acidobacteriaceae bacterium]|jgi:signal transduction histidine kinase|nr:ATP-binding protein [Acidobacteriaceae bacterium]